MSGNALCFLAGLLCLAGVTVLWCLTPWWVALLCTVVLGPAGIWLVMISPWIGMRCF